jgi:glycosyltransferase involved in cell wall biosynthesis
MHWLPAILIFPYFFLLLWIYRGLLKIKTFSVTAEPVTFVSVVVACRNMQENLTILLDCINSQDYPKDLFEVIIVDDNSTDRTFETGSVFPFQGNRIAIYNKGTGKKDAIMTGIDSASGLLIITTDADCRMGKKWIRNIAAYYEKFKPEMIICPVQVEAGPGVFGKFQELEFLSLQGITAGSAFTGNGTMCNGANLSFTRESFFNNADNLHSEIASGDDIFLLHSLKQKSHSKILWLESSDAKVTTGSSPTVVSFLKQRKRWISKGKAYNDRFTIILGIITFVTILLQLSVLFAAVFNHIFFPVFIVIFLLKSVPDYLILLNTSGRYGNPKLMNWFIPAQIVYPFYVLCVAFYSLISIRKQDY